MVVTSARFYWPLLSVSACGCRSLPPISSNACRLLPCPPPPHVRAAFSYDRSAQPGDARASHMTIGTSHMTIGTGTGTGGPQAAAQPQRTRDFREIEFTGPLRRPVKSAWNEMDAEDSGCASPTAASPHPQPHRLTHSRIGRAWPYLPPLLPSPLTDPPSGAADPAVQLLPIDLDPGADPHLIDGVPRHLRGIAERQQCS